MHPSEGNPQFHQQMVYAVAMTTIANFERALGRRALWAPRYEVNADEQLRLTDVPQLRIYPHALRTSNAYYSPQKKALLFGYFAAESKDGDVTTPGSMVFSCLSADIIAHEMTHALLDGLHQRFDDVSNLDVPAFHEGFADIVALFQHFEIPELVRFELGRARGDLSAAGLLGELAKQFGEGTNRRGPLRNYRGPGVRDLKYSKTLDIHDRGSILVYAVYEAFIKVAAFRANKTIRLATGGSGILPAGSLHPDLVDRLTEQTCETARYILQMCIRALDYCPSVDITFGEYLRALITADRDIVREDIHGFRVSFMEAFRNRGILPEGIRTVSEETLAWGTLSDPRFEALNTMLKSDIDLRWDTEMNRAEIFEINEKNRWPIWRGLNKAFQVDPSLCTQLGLMADLPRYHEDGTVARQPTSGGTTFDIFSVRPTRRVAPDGSFRTELVIVIQQRQPQPVDPGVVGGSWFWFRGSTTLIVDVRLGREEVRYAIVKGMNDSKRLERQRALASRSYLSPLRSLYFGATNAEPFAMMHADVEGRRDG